VRVPARMLGVPVVSTGNELGAAGVSACCELGGLGAVELGRAVSGLCTGELFCALSGLCTGKLGCSAGGSAFTVCSVDVLLVRGLGGRGATGRSDANDRAALPLAGRTEAGAALGELSCLNLPAGRTEGGVALGARAVLLAMRDDGGASPGGTLLAECGAFRPMLRASAFDFSGAALGAALSRVSSLAGAAPGRGAPERDSVDGSGCCSKVPGSVVATGGGVFDRWGGLGGTILRKPGRIAGGGWEGAGTAGRWYGGAI